MEKNNKSKNNFLGVTLSLLLAAALTAFVIIVMSY